jgi:hypothetical protein
MKIALWILVFFPLTLMAQTNKEVTIDVLQGLC